MNAENEEISFENNDKNENELPNYNVAIAIIIFMIMFFLGMLIPAIIKIKKEFETFDSDAAVFNIINQIGVFLIFTGIAWLLIAKVKKKRRDLIKSTSEKPDKFGNLLS